MKHVIDPAFNGLVFVDAQEIIARQVFGPRALPASSSTPTAGDSASVIVAEQVYGPRLPAVPTVRAADASVTVTRDALGYLLSAPGGGSTAPDDAGIVVAGQVYAPHAQRAKITRAADTSITVTADALGYALSVPADTASPILAGQAYAPHGARSKITRAADASISVTEDALGYALSVPAAAPDSASPILAGQVYAPHALRSKITRAADASITVVEDALGYALSVPAAAPPDDTNHILAGRIYAPHPDRARGSRSTNSAVLPVTQDAGGYVFTPTQADTTHDGYLTASDWNTFNGKQSALTFPLAANLGGTGVNNATRTITVNTNPAIFAFGGAFTLTVAANASVSNTNTGDQTITLTGDVSGSGSGSFAATLATVNSNVGTFGDATHVGQFTVNGKGLITAASNVVITGSSTTPDDASIVLAGQAYQRRSLINTINTFANPTALIGLTAINGVALTALRSDAAPALDQGINPTWTGVHKFSNTGLRIASTGAGYLTLTAASLMAADHTLSIITGSADRFISFAGNLQISADATVLGVNSGDQSGGNPTAAVGLTAVNGSAITFMRSDGAPALDVGISPTWGGNHIFTNQIKIAATSNQLVLQSAGVTGTLTWTPTGSNKTITLPDASGTVVLDSRTINGYSLAANVTLDYLDVNASPANHSHYYVSPYRYINVSGLGLTGGGFLQSDITIALASSNNPGATASILATNPNGNLTLGSSAAQGFTVAPTASSGAVFGIYSQPNINATTTGVYGVYSQPTTIGSATFTLTAAYSFFADNPNKVDANSTITTAYGVYVASITAGSTNYAIYVAGGQVRSANTTDTTSTTTGALVIDGGAAVAKAIFGGSKLSLAATSNQIVLQASGVTGTITWTPTSSNKTLTIADVSGTVALGTGAANTMSYWTGTNTQSNVANATGYLKNNGSGSFSYTDGGLFVALTTPINLTDTGAGVWDGTQNKAVGTYTFDLAASANGSLPSGIKAILAVLNGTWTVAASGSTGNLRPRGGATNIVINRAEVANFANAEQGICPVDTTNFDIDCVVAGATMNSAVIRMIGYFI